MMQTAVQVVSLHDRKGTLLAVDLKDVLLALEKQLGKWTWYMRLLECVGGEYSQAMCQAAESSEARGLWISEEDLLKLAQDLDQTIDGEWIAFPKAIDPEQITQDDLNLGFFPTSKAELAIAVIDSTFVQVYAKDAAVITALQRHFKDVRLEDPANHFFDQS
jgi:hypothetical protein